MCVWCERSVIADRLTAGLTAAAVSRRGFLTRAAVAAVVGGGGRSLGATGAAATVFRNGTIRTQAGGPATVEALAIADGQILAVGSAAEVTAAAPAGARLVDLQGRALLPGLIDPHHHTVLAALFTHLLHDVGVSRYRTRADVLAALKAEAAMTPPGGWIAAGFYDNILQGGDLAGADLDAVSTAHPIFVMYVNGHVGAANAPAFARAGIAADVGTLPGGGRFGRGPDGRLDGRIYEQPALVRFTAVALPEPTPAIIAEAVTAYAKQAAAAGNTTLHEPGTIQPAWVEDLARLSNDLDVRLSASFSTDAVAAGAAFAAVGPEGRARRIPDSRLSLYGMKFWADGSNQAGSAAQTKPYLGSGEKGLPNHSAAEMAGLCRAARDAGWSILIHCQGDAAIDAALDAIEKSYGRHPATGINRLEHATMARRDQIERMKQLGVEPSFIPDFVHLYGGEYRERIFGPARAEFMVPAGAAARAGIGFTLHSDAPAAGLPINPLRHVQTAVTRRCATDGSVVGPELAVTVDEALRAITASAARQIGLGDVLGTIEPGKEADLTILESDPCRIDPEKIADIRVSETWVAGERKFG